MARHTGKVIGLMAIAAVAFLAGYWPEHQRYLNASSDLRLTDTQLREARGRERVYRLENMLLQALDRTAHKEYKEARVIASEFFIEVRADIARPDMTRFAPELKEILEKSDAIKDALEQEDQSARDLVRGVMQQLAKLVSPPPAASEPPPVISVTQTPQS